MRLFVVLFSESGKLAQRAVRLATHSNNTSSSVFVALYAIYIKKVLPAVNDNTWLLMIYNNINASILMPIW